MISRKKYHIVKFLIKWNNGPYEYWLGASEMDSRGQEQLLLFQKTKFSPQLPYELDHGWGRT